MSKKRIAYTVTEPGSKQDNLPVGMSKEGAARAVENLILSSMQRQVDELRAVLDFHPRAAKLMRKHKNFIVIAEDEPYYLKAYEMIREQEMVAGRWTDEDERAWLNALKDVA